MFQENRLSLLTFLLCLWSNQILYNNFVRYGIKSLQYLKMKINLQKLLFLGLMPITLSGHAQVRLDDWETGYPTYTSLSKADQEQPESVVKVSLFGEKIESWERICKYKKIR